MAGKTGVRLKLKQRELEYAILALALMDDEAICKLSEHLEPDCFQLETCRSIYQAMLMQYMEGESVEAGGLKERLKIKMPEEAQRLARVVDKLKTVSPEDNTLLEYVDEIKSRFLEIRVDTVVRILSKKGNEDKTPMERAVMAIKELEGLMAPVSETGWQSANDLARATVREAAGRRDMNSAKPEACVRVPFLDLLPFIHQLEGRQFAVLAGCPGSGKTAFASSLALKLARAGHSVAYVSAELPSDMLMLRLASAESGISLSQILKGSYSDASYVRLVTAIDEISRMPIYMMAPPVMSPRLLYHSIRQLKEESPIKLVVVDSLEMVHMPGYRDREKEVVAIYRKLRALARELDVFLLLLAPLRSVWNKSRNLYPTLMDLPGGESAQVLLDVILAFYEAEAVVGDVPEQLREVTLSVLKNRMGNTGRLKLAFLPGFVKFEDYRPV